MGRRLLRSESPLGCIAWEEYQLIARALYERSRRSPGSLIKLGASLEMRHNRHLERLAKRVIKVPAGHPYLKCTGGAGETLSSVFSEIERSSASKSRVRLTEYGYALVKSVERNGLGLGLLYHTSQCLDWREALLVEVCQRFSKAPGSPATIPLDSLRHWLGITGKYPRLANIEDAIFNRRNSTALFLSVLEAYESPASGDGFVTLQINPSGLDQPIQDLVLSPCSAEANIVSKRLGIPLIAAVAMIENAQSLLPEKSFAHVAGLLAG